MAVLLSAVVARNLRAERSRLGWRQEDLAERLKIDRTTVSAWEAGRSNIGLDWLEPLCSTLGVDLADLFRGLEPARLQVLGVRDVRQR